VVFPLSLLDIVYRKILSEGLIATRGGMAALAGVWRIDGRTDAARDCGRILEVQERYGPDSAAQWSDGGVALGPGRRGPLSACGRCPARDDRNEMISTLQIPTAGALTRSDAAILLAAIGRWDESCLRIFRGLCVRAVGCRVPAFAAGA
jgi:hypothetical protein